MLSEEGLQKDGTVTTQTTKKRRTISIANIAIEKYYSVPNYKTAKTTTLQPFVPYGTKLNNVTYLINFSVSAFPPLLFRQSGFMVTIGTVWGLFNFLAAVFLLD